jgi:hypothetical protein
MTENDLIVEFILQQAEKVFEIMPNSENRAASFKDHEFQVFTIPSQRVSGRTAREAILNAIKKAHDTRRHP